MSFNGSFFDYIRRSFSRQFSNEGDFDAVTADFTSQYADRAVLCHDIRRGRVDKVKIYIKDLMILKENIEYLKDSLTDLRIRPHTFRSEDVAEPSDAFRLLSYEAKCFLRDLRSLVNLEHFTLDNDGAQTGDLLDSVSYLHKMSFLTLQNSCIETLDTTLPCTLKQLDLSGNILSVFPSAITQLKQLEILILCRNALSELPDVICELEKLKKLDLSYNQLRRIPDSLLELKNLIKLYITSNCIEELPQNIGKLSTLKHLELRGNKICFLPDSIGDLHQLIKLNLCGNKLTALPETICNLEIDDDGLLISGNPLQLPPVELCVQGKGAMKGYFDALRYSHGIKCRRLKLILLGESFAGKTSLANALVYKRDAKIPPDERTVGLDFYKWRPNPHLENDIEINLIDCAGQRKYLLTHQFFFTEGALFVLVLDLSQYSMSDYDYRVMVGDWINLVISHIPNAVIIIVPTHIDVCQDKGEDVDQKCEDVLKRIHAEEERRVEFLGKEKEILKADSEDTRSKETLESLQRTRPFFSSCFYSKDNNKQNIGDSDILLVPVCCKDYLQGIGLLQKEILRIADNVTLCPIVNKEVPQNWVPLEEEMMALKDQNDMPFIAKDLLFAMMLEKFEDLNGEMFNSALLYLNAVGTIAWFNSVRRASHLVFLNPQWLINLLQLLFRHDHEVTLNYKSEFLDQNTIFYEQFLQDKSLFLTEGRLSNTLLSCIWSQMLGKFDNNLLSQIVEILQHFGIICKLPADSTTDDIIYFIPWFIAEQEPEGVMESWTKCNMWEKTDNVIFKITTSVARLPQSIFERLLVQIHARAELCTSWKSGFLISRPKYKLLCNVDNGNYNSSVNLHGKCCHGFIDDVWRLIFDIWKELDVLIDEWSGIVMRRAYTLCPLCVGRNRRKPYIFFVDLKNNPSSREPFSCRLCYSFIDADLVFPPNEIVRDVLNDNRNPGSQITLKDPLSDKELGVFAEKIGVKHAQIALKLGLTQDDIDVAQENHPHSQYNQAMELLKKWKRARGAANRHELIAAVRDLENFDPNILRFLQYGRT